MLFCRSKSSVGRHTANETNLPRILLIVLAAFLRVQAQVPPDQLAKPPAGAQAFTVLSTAGTHGMATIWTAGDGSNMSRESILLRGQVWEVDQSVKLGSDGMPSTWVVRGVTPQGDAAENFEISAGVASWKSPIDAGNHRYASPAFYIS